MKEKDMKKFLMFVAVALLLAGCSAKEEYALAFAKHEQEFTKHISRIQFVLMWKQG